MLWVCFGVCISVCARDPVSERCALFLVNIRQLWRQFARCFQLIEDAADCIEDVFTRTHEFRRIDGAKEN